MTTTRRSASTGGGAGAPPSGQGPSGQESSSGDWRRGYRDVVRVGEFRALWVAHALSMTGSYLLNIAVALLVYHQTSSALAAGITMALTFLPQIIGGPLLSGLADLFPRRRVIVISDLTRAVLVAGIGIPGLPVWAIWVLVFCSTLPMVPFGAARAALMAEIVQGERYVAGSAIINITTQVGTLAGLVLGGGVVAAVGPNSAVMFNGLTFVASAAIIRFGVRYRPAPRDEREERPSLWRVTREGTRVVFGDARLRTLGLFAWLAGFYAIPYGLAGPLADEVGGGAMAAGLLMAGPSMGAIIGGFVLTRLINPESRMRLIGPLAVAASVPLLAWALHPPLWVMVGLLMLSGMTASYQFVANAAFVLCAPSKGRGLAFGLVAAGLQAVQGIGIALASLLVEVTGLHVVITVAGGLGVAGALLLASPWSRLSSEAIALMHTPPDADAPDGDQAPGPGPGTGRGTRPQ
ncbi:MFS transporter [Nocardiopsis gilva YIM 90087]|uniref:MFS transporter n=1 Tax=Nocardiopsis gilva YIM 90087 TaxID=1235441 RepID=A0A223SEE8_9ACTN|nr:MFS transporter [Nocardiopsis gilva]ASU86463.1 MFS transporter [Nocardiopsis gilva YIM 90087]